MNKFVLWINKFWSTISEFVHFVNNISMENIFTFVQKMCIKGVCIGFGWLFLAVIELKSPISFSLSVKVFVLPLYNSSIKSNF